VAGVASAPRARPFGDVDAIRHAPLSRRIRPRRRRQEQGSVINAMTKNSLVLATVLAWLTGAPAIDAVSEQTPASAPAAPLSERFEKQVQAYEAADKAARPPEHAILLVGDSQFFRWKTLADDLPGYTVINRGVDSFQCSDMLQFFDRIVSPYHPRLIVVHVGGNDIHTGKSPERLLADLQMFVTRVRARQPATPILISSITPGPGRWDEADRRRQANQRVKAWVATQANLHYVDLWDAMLTKDGQPREDLWVADRIHPNHDGYLLRVEIMRPLLGPPDKASK
jgi:lysophospholipase L1-like esterase